MGASSDRVTPQSGATMLKDKKALAMAMNSELRPIGCCIKILMRCACCSAIDMERSYLYIRENSIESNLAIQPCCGCCQDIDQISVSYFDRPPFQPGCCNNCQAGTPEIRVLDNGCMCCCQTICSDKVAVVATPNLPFPCCCCANAATKCDSCFGLCGPITGNPKYISAGFLPGPNDAEKFVATAQGILGSFAARGSPPSAEAEVESEEMHRS